MASKRKADSQLQRSALSRIPARLQSSSIDVSAILPENESRKENMLRSSTAIKKMRIDQTSTPKPGSTFPVHKAFKAPLPLQQRAVPQCAARNLAMAKPRTAPAAVSTSTTVSSTTGAIPKQAKKRNPWDLKGQVEDLKSTKADLISRLKTKTSQHQEISEALSQLQTDHSQLQENFYEVSQQIVLKDNSLMEAHDKISSLETEIMNMKVSLQSATQTVEALNKIQLEHEKEIKNLNFSVTEYSGQLQAKEAKLGRIELQNLEFRSQNEKLANSLAECERLLQLNERERRKQHNLIQELKGNIRVFCRVRPFLSNEPKSDIVTFLEDGQALTISKPMEGNESNPNKSRGTSRTEFKFDKVFSPQSSQEQVFEEISQLVQSALDGYHVCIFAYGQTGSGKTFTMEGPACITDFVCEAENEMLGMIPRAVAQVFETANQLSSRGWEYTMEVSIMEIYNEAVKDLLVSSASKSSQVSMQKGRDCAMASTTTIVVHCEDDVYNLLKRARKHRAVAATSYNEYSSRSHSIFCLKLSGRNSNTGEACEGTLSLVDLAGSERLKETGTDARMREMKSINKSLSNLGNVIMALAQKAEHIPYRNSKLTHILMNSLGGNSKTLMFVNVSPSTDHYPETMNSLRFATKVNNCNIGTATKVLKQH